MSVVDQLIKGAIDFHVHGGPHPFRIPRLDALKLATQAREMGMRAIVDKSNYYCTAPLCSIVNSMNPGFSLVGSIVLNSAVGGLNAEVVEVAIRTGAKVVWLPTESAVTSVHRTPGKVEYPVHSAKLIPKTVIPVAGADGKLMPQMGPILDLIKDNDVVLATGHISVVETYAVVAEARRRQIKVTVTHPLTPLPGAALNLQQQQELAAQGAYIEHCFLSCMPPGQRVNPRVMVEHIKAVGVEHCILDTDFGQDTDPAPAEGFRMMLGIMLTQGLTEKELEILVKRNPAKLLNLD